MALVDRHPLKEKRRANKPLLERKRRARINDSLSDLKHLVLSSLNKDVSKYAKMEKVDILDMTVQYLKGRSVERNDNYSSIYKAGYSESTKEIYQSIMTMEGIEHTLKCRILSNLASTRPERNSSPPPSPTLSRTSHSPIPSPTTTPDKQTCLSTIFDPSSGRNTVPMGTSPNNYLMTGVTGEHLMKYQHRLTNTPTIRTIPEQLPRLYCNLPKVRCDNPRLYCDNVLPKQTKSSTVWRPW